MNELYLPFILQGVVMVADEFGFHHQRGLPLWEKIGHPLDTLTTLLTLMIPAFFELTPRTQSIYTVLAIFSCLIITKDEFIHKDICSKTEQWLHSILFIIHPLTFIAAYIIWRSDEYSVFLKFQVLLVLTFLIYQIIRWCFPWIQFRR